MRMRILTAMAIVTALAITAGTAAAGASGTSGATCHPAGKTILNRDGVVVWVTNRKSITKERVWLCGVRTGSTQRLYPGPEWVVDSLVAGAKVTQFQHQGNYVGFFLTVGGSGQGGRTLFVFNTARGTMEVADFAYCGGNDECTGPWMTRYELASNGWVAEKIGPLQVPADGLVATNGGAHHYELDVAPISHLSLSHGTVSWQSGFSAASSVKLGRDVITPAKAGNATVCQLLPASELKVVFSHGATHTHTATTCTYTSKTDPTKTLTVTLTTGMTPTQQQQAENELNGWEMPYGTWWPQNDDFFVRQDTPSHPGQFAVIVNGAEVQFDLSKPGSGAGARLGHLAVVAVDQLFGVPIKRAR